MKKTITTLDAVNLCNALSTIANDQSRKMPGAISWAVYRTYKSLKEINDDFEKFRNEKITEMYDSGKAIADENQNVQIKQEHISEFVTFINEILSTEVEVELHNITQEAFEKLLDTCELSIPEVEVFEKLIKEE